MAPQFDISHVGLKNICKKFDIPVPPRGYWAKPQAGKPATKVALPPRAAGMDDEMVIGGRNLHWSYRLTDERIVKLVCLRKEFSRPQILASLIGSRTVSSKASCSRTQSIILARSASSIGAMLGSTGRDILGQFRRETATDASVGDFLPIMRASSLRSNSLASSKGLSKRALYSFASPIKSDNRSR